MKIGLVGRLILGSCLFPLLMVAGVEIALAQAEEKLGPNLIENGDCEAQDAEGTWGQDGPGQQMMSEGAHGGKRCLKLICKEQGESARFSRDHKKAVPIDAAKAYRISCWVKVQGEGAFYLRVKSVTDTGKNDKPPKTGVRDSLGVKDTGGNWKEVEMNYRLVEGEEGVKALCISPRIRGKGEVLIDDVEVRERSKQAIVAEQLKLETYSTIHCMGLRIKGVSEEIVGARVQYRKEGETAWQAALPLALCLGNKFVEEGWGGATWEDLAPMIRRFHGSLFYLEPATVYEVKASLLDKENKVKGELQAKARTKPDEVVVGKGRMLKVGANDEYKTIQAAVKTAKPGDTVLVSPGVYKESIVEWPSGEPGNPITVRGMNGAVLDGSDVPQIGTVQAGIYIKNSHDLTLEGFKVQRYDYRIFVEGCERVVVQKNVIDCKAGSYGLKLKKSKDCLVQLNEAIGPEEGQGATACPYTIDGSEGVVFRYNRVVGGSGYLIATDGNRETDIYENYFNAQANAGVEGGAIRNMCINVRYWNNIHAVGTTLQLTPVMVGPLYVFRNVFVAGGSIIGCSGLFAEHDVGVLNEGHIMADFGPAFLWHNTFDARSAITGRESFGRLGCRCRLVFVNNVFLGRSLPYEAVTAAMKMGRKSVEYVKVEADYNVYWEDMWKEKGTPTKASITPGLDEHSVFAEAQFVDPAKLDFRLKEGTPGIDKGVLIPGVSANFKGAAPDMGALEAGGENWVQKVLEKTKECGVTK